MKIFCNNPKLTPVQTRLLARSLVFNIKSFYEDEKNQKLFDDWKAKKRGEKVCN